jgi:hypothetical protein
MAFLENNTYTTIKEAIKYSSGEYGCIAVYLKDANSLPVYFINGRPFLSFKS